VYKRQPELREAALRYSEGLGGRLQALSPEYGESDPRGGGVPLEDGSKPLWRYLPKASGQVLRGGSYQRQRSKN